MDPLTLGIIGGVSQALPAIAGFFDDSEAKAVQARNQARVDQINRQNDAIHFDNLAIRARYGAQKNNVLQNIDAIKTADMASRAAGQTRLDNAYKESLAANQADYIKMVRGMTGNRSGRVNLDRSSLAELGRARSARAAALMRGGDALITQNANQTMRTQSDIANQMASVAMLPQYKQYIQDYTPETYTRNTLADSLKLGGSLLGAYTYGSGIYNKLTPPKVTGE